MKQDILQQKENLVFFDELNNMVKIICADAPHPISALANISALLYHKLVNLNWVGFYLFDGENLIVGPFQGIPACTTIPIGKGVCGTAAYKKKTIIVHNVENFTGHISCDSQSKSEIVVPLLSKNEKLLGVIDIDSPLLKRFSTEWDTGLTKISKTISESINWKKLTF